jgi:hypothetical protein
MILFRGEGRVRETSKREGEKNKPWFPSNSSSILLEHLFSQSKGITE